MITFWGQGAVEEQLRVAAQVGQEIARWGLSVVRVKVETGIEGDEVPECTSEACDRLTQYFEHHIKVVLSDFEAVDLLRQRAAERGARLSQNIRRQRADGTAERFVTQRVFGLGRVDASSILNQLLERLRESGFCIAEVEQEYVVFDSNLAVDSGWL
ncbi:hypothetical protein [Schlesneria sp. T3-172]|uniref:hypothetical protein n=1 Tax=Schlesneria sphaerica TaxID=3373610 RepID=UPI0037C9740C